MTFTLGSNDMHYTKTFRIQRLKFKANNLSITFWGVNFIETKMVFPEFKQKVRNS